MKKDLKKCIKCKHFFPKKEMSFYKNTKRLICNDCNNSLNQKKADSFEEHDPTPPEVEDKSLTENEKFEHTYDELIKEIKNLFLETKTGEWSRYGIDTQPSVPTIYWVNKANIMLILFKDKPFYRKNKIIGKWISSCIPKYKAYFDGRLNLL
ncbi:MAG: hypothetical protein ACFE95_12365 [Candidatus Hodarchaeota archaeon]